MTPEIRQMRRLCFSMGIITFVLSLLGLTIVLLGPGDRRAAELRGMTFLLASAIFTMVLTRPSTWRQ